MRWILIVQSRMTSFGASIRNIYFAITFIVRVLCECRWSFNLSGFNSCGLAVMNYRWIWGRSNQSLSKRFDGSSSTVQLESALQFQFEWFGLQCDAIVGNDVWEIASRRYNHIECVHKRSKIQKQTRFGQIFSDASSFTCKRSKRLHLINSCGLSMSARYPFRMEWIDLHAASNLRARLRIARDETLSDPSNILRPYWGCTVKLAWRHLWVLCDREIWQFRSYDGQCRAVQRWRSVVFHTKLRPHMANGCDRLSWAFASCR